MNRRVVLLGAVLAVLGILLGYSVGSRRVPLPPQQQTNQTQGVKPERGATYAMNVVVSGVPFWVDTKAAWQKIGQANSGVTTLFGGPDGTDAQAQIDEINALLEKKIDGLVVAPADSAALNPTINKAVAQGIPVITYLVDAPGSKRLTYVASELETASKRIAEMVTANGRPSGKALILYAQTGNAEQEARRRGFEEFIAQHSGMRLVGVIEDHYAEDKGAELVKAALVKNPDLRFIFGCNSRSAVGAVTALRELGGRSPGQVTVTGWDTDQDVLELIKQRWVQGSVAQHSAFMTQVIYSILDARRRGYLYPPTRSFEKTNIPPVPDQLIIPTLLVTPENVGGFYPKQETQ